MRVLITGTSHGIGKATAEKFLAKYMGLKIVKVKIEEFIIDGEIKHN